MLAGHGVNAEPCGLSSAMGACVRVRQSPTRACTLTPLTAAGVCACARRRGSCLETRRTSNSLAGGRTG
eukprot:3226652-Prymnesium_polylepis.2